MDEILSRFWCGGCRKAFRLSKMTSQKMPKFSHLRRIQIDNGRLFCCAYAIAPEQKARTTYDNILRLSDDPDVNRVIAYLREREVVHFQRFGEALDRVQSKMTRPRSGYRMSQPECGSNPMGREF